jgi:hypothetical protein
MGSAEEKRDPSFKSGGKVNKADYYTNIVHFMDDTPTDYFTTKEELTDKALRGKYGDDHVFISRFTSVLIHEGKSGKKVVHELKEGGSLANKEKVIYKVYVYGDAIKEEEVFFKSIKKAKDYMKDKYDFYKSWDVSLFTLSKIVYRTDKDLELGNTDTTQVNTRTTIFNM